MSPWADAWRMLIHSSVDPGADAHPVLCKAGPGARVSQHLGRVRSWGLWLQDPWFPGVVASLLLGGSMSQYLPADPR